MTDEEEILNLLEINEDEYTPEDEFQEEFQEIQEETSSLGDKISDFVAKKFGSWIFLGLFMVFCIIWVILNISIPNSIDPYPFIFLTLLLSLLAIICTAILQISQNRKDYKDSIRSQMIFELCQSIMVDIQEVKLK